MTDRHIIITGGSSGIGKAVAKLYLAKGDRVTIIARREAVLAEAKAELEKAAPGARVLTKSADVSDRIAITRAIDEAIVQFGPADVLVASAGMVYPDYFEKLPIETFEQHMAVNYFGTLYALNAVLPAMRARKKGRVVIVSSGAGLIGIFGYTAYCPTKFALRGLAESLRGELKRDGIGVTIAYPPDTDTPQLHQENLTKPKETKAMTGTAKMWPADGVAKKIVEGAEAGRFTVTPGWEMAALGRLHSLLRPALDWHFDRLAAKVQKDAAKA